ncbi:MAG: hypothetical protein EBT49_04705 [Betaproteobacteria bacterium]|nr:hypothetical protein [Betaproteobacteria bacterium]
MEPGCVGALCDEYFEVRIVDPEKDTAVAIGSIGEIAIRPKVPFAFMQGYLGRPDVTVGSWRNLWFHTGDGGRLDERGRLHFIDRIGDFIRRRGENISPFEIEHILSSHPVIEECAVVGVRIDGAGGEDEILVHVVRGEGSVSHVELLEWSKARLPRYAIPRFWEFVEVIEKTPTGKVKKQALRTLGVTAKTWDREMELTHEKNPPLTHPVTTL